MRWKTIALALLAGALALGAGIAYATIPNGGVIHGCYSRSGGALRVIDANVTNCKSSETSLDWNVQGPTGQRGPTGPSGPQGEQGLPGSSDGYYVEHDGSVELPSSTPTTVLTMHLPAGSYLLAASTQIAAPGFESFTGCSISQVGGGSWSSTTKVEDQTQIDTLFHATSSAPLEVDYICNNGGGETASAIGPIMTAVRVGALRDAGS